MSEIGHILDQLVMEYIGNIDRNRAYLCLEIYCIVPDQYEFLRLADVGLGRRCKYVRDRAHFGPIGHGDILEIII